VRSLWGPRGHRRLLCLARHTSRLQQCDKIRVWGPSLPSRNGHESIIDVTPISGAGGLRKRSGPCSSRNEQRQATTTLAETKNEHLVRARLPIGAASFAFAVRPVEINAPTPSDRDLFFSLISGNGDREAAATALFPSLRLAVRRGMRSLWAQGARGSHRKPKADAFSGQASSPENPSAADYGGPWGRLMKAPSPVSWATDGGSVAPSSLLLRMRMNAKSLIIAGDGFRNSFHCLLEVLVT
jgi:hypothetical protein